jgi:hypothetical protein
MPILIDSSRQSIRANQNNSAASRWHNPFSLINWKNQIMDKRMLH